MTDRILDIAEGPAWLRLIDGRLAIERKDAACSEIPIADLSVVVVSHPQATITQGALAALAAAGVAFVTCDRRHMPVGMLLPLDAHHVQAQRFAMQASATEPTRKRAWQQIVRAKLRAQGELLRRLTGSDAGITAMISRVRSGDPANIEAQAARRYWPEVFADPDFRRRQDAEDQNRHLNYGYAVLRGIVARAVCAAGLHPSLGVHHHHRSNAYCLADDLMEPLRPIVDLAVVEIVKERGPAVALDREAKTILLRSLTASREGDGENRSLVDWTSRMAGALANVLAGDERQLRLPLIM